MNKSWYQLAWLSPNPVFQVSCVPQNWKGAGRIKNFVTLREEKFDGGDPDRYMDISLE